MLCQLRSFTMEFTCGVIGFSTEEYYNRFIELQERLRKSEEERLQLEMKFNAMIQTTQDEEQLYYKRLKSQYKRFVEEDHRRRQRNEALLEMLERIESRAAVLEAKTQRFKLLRNQYHSFLARMAHEGRFKKAALGEDPLSMSASQQNIDPHWAKLNGGDLGLSRTPTVDEFCLLARFKEQRSNEVDIAEDVIRVIKERNKRREGLKRIVVVEDGDTDESTTSVILSLNQQPIIQEETKLECEHAAGMTHDEKAENPKNAEFVEILDENQNALSSHSVQDDIGKQQDLQEMSDGKIEKNHIFSDSSNNISNVQINDENHALERNSIDSFAKEDEEASPYNIINLPGGDIVANMVEQCHINSNSPGGITTNIEEQANKVSDEIENQSAHVDTVENQEPSPIAQEDIPVVTVSDERNQQLPTAAEGNNCMAQYDEHSDASNLDRSDLQSMQDSQNAQIYYDDSGQPVQYHPNQFCNQEDLEQYDNNYQYDENGQPVDYSQITLVDYDENGQLINYSQDAEIAEQGGVEYQAENDPANIPETEQNYDGYNYELTREIGQDGDGQKLQVTENDDGEIHETNNETEENAERLAANVIELLETESEKSQNATMASSNGVNKMAANENESDFDFSSASGQENPPGIQH